MAVTRQQVARAIAYFEQSSDPAELHSVLEGLAPRARRIVGDLLHAGGEDAIPAPADLSASRDVASASEALQTAREVADFSLLQSLARAIGRRAEALEIVASADFPKGARVSVPQAPTFTAGQPRLNGAVESSGTTLKVRLDNGEAWEGAATLARLLGG